MIDKAFAQSANALAAVKGFLIEPTAPQSGTTVAFTRGMYDRLANVDADVAQLFAASWGNKMGQATLASRLDCTPKPVEKQQAVAVTHGTEIESMGLPSRAVRRAG